MQVMLGLVVLVITFLKVYIMGETSPISHGVSVGGSRVCDFGTLDPGTEEHGWGCFQVMQNKHW
jgi:hypothetical protein